MSFRKLETLIAIKEPLSIEDEKLFTNAVKAIVQLKKISSKINEGLANEEPTVTAKWHICHHDEPGNQISCKDTEIEL